MTLDWHKTLGWTPSAAQQQYFEQFYEALLRANQSLNLTRITSRDEFWEKHLWDSLSGIQPWLCQDSPADWMTQLKNQCSIHSVIDIGTGGGVPGIPVAIACPHWSVTLLDSTQKKIQSLTQIAQAISCETVHPYCDRAETLGRNLAHREQYDLALIRAVAAPSVCVEYALPFLKDHGIVILYRGHWCSDEEAEFHHALKVLGGEVFKVHSFKTPLSKSDRHCVYVIKTMPTPEKYPRRVGVPTRKPL